jgi:D-beta-D-heptose 7-phosphate kinase/D-beta-D-heptose 1-phosphate adenosyltransferase
MKAFLDRFPGVSAAVIGDLMLDCYLSGDVSRISPEAPVPVMRAQSERAVAGGAANVAANLAALDLRVHVVGLAGQDEAREELVASMSAEHTSPAINDGRHVTLDEAVALRWSWANERLTVGVASGCFDLLHPGHVALIRQAALSCDRLILALNADDSVRRLKGPLRPVQEENARAAVVGAIKGVSAVVVFAEDTPLELIQVLQPDVLVKGSDYTEDQVVGADVVKARGGRVVLVDLAPGHSTPNLVAAAGR